MHRKVFDYFYTAEYVKTTQMKKSQIILFAVSLGIAAAFIRRSISKFRQKYFNKAIKQSK